MRATFEELSVLWDEGRRGLEAAEPRDRAALERVVDAVVLELRRRLGGNFTVDELARVYMEEGTDWCFDIAIRTAPATPAAWDLSTVSGAAFARFARRARNYGGGRRRTSDEEG